MSTKKPSIGTTFLLISYQIEYKKTLNFVFSALNLKPAHKVFKTP